MKYLKIKEEEWDTLMEGYLYKIGTWKNTEEKAEFYQQLFESVLAMVEESNGGWQ